MSEVQDVMIYPEIEGLIERAGSKFALCTVTAQRAREINSYFGQLGDGLGAMVPPQVTSVSRKPVSIAFQEIAADKIVPGPPTDQEAETKASSGKGTSSKSTDSDK